MTSKRKIKRRRQLNAGKASTLFRFLGATKWTAKDQRKADRQKLGKLGKASGVRKIDPADYTPQLDRRVKSLE